MKIKEIKIDWKKWSAIITAVGVLFAIFSPSIKEMAEEKSITKALDNELSKAYDICDMANNFTDTNFTEASMWVSGNQLKYVAARNINIDVWLAFRFELAKLNHKEFLAYNELYSSLVDITERVEEVENSKEENPQANIDILIISDDISQFVSVYKNK